MTSNIVELQRLPQLMECVECDSEAFSLHSDGSIHCLDCGGKISAYWARLTSSSPPTVVGPSGEG